MLLGFLSVVWGEILKPLQLVGYSDSQLEFHPKSSLSSCSWVYVPNELKGTAHLRKMIQMLDIGSSGSCSVTKEVM